MSGAYMSPDVRDARWSVGQLAALSTLSAVWSHSDPKRIAEGLADVAFRTLRAAFAYVRVQNVADHPLYETARAEKRLDAAALGALLGPFLDAGNLDEVPSVPSPLGGGAARLAVVPIGCVGDCGFLVVGALSPGFPDQTERLLLSVAANQAAVALHQERTARILQAGHERLSRLASAALMIHSATTTEGVLKVAAEQARHIIGTHMAVSSLTVDQHWQQAISTVSLSDNHAQWRAYDDQPDGTGIYSIVCRENRPLRLTRRELEAHPAFRRHGDAVHEHPPPRGWLAVPLVGRDGSNLGLIQVSDRTDGGDFSPDDEAVLVQLCTIASVAVENARLYEGLRDADRRKDEFLATLSHELRSPLAPIRNAVDFLKGGAAADPETMRMRGVLDRQVRHLARLIDDLMDVSRITQGKLTIRRNRLDLALVARDAVDVSRPYIRQCGHELKVALSPVPIPVEGDATRLEQIIANLLTNAAKYTEKGGVISLDLEREGAEAIIRVQDTGVGIAREHLPQLFRMFSQVTAALDRSQGGLGIGLALVRGLVELHGGSVEAHSEGPGHGAQFVVRLPLAQGSAGIEEAVGTQTPAPAPARRILVVDDNRDAAESLSLLLRHLGHTVRTAHDGLEAVQAAEAFRPEVALLDIGLPGINGYEAAQRIRAQPWGRAIALIATSGWGREEHKRRAQEAGFDHHLTKPVELAALEKLLVERA